jgi:heme exporter protein A
LAVNGYPPVDRHIFFRRHEGARHVSPPHGERLEARDLACLRGERPVFRGVDFALAAGEALRLTGPNGSGKSSLLRLVAGFGRPASGRILWDGADLSEARNGEARRGLLLYLGHLDAIKPWLSVGENLAFSAALHAVVEPKAIERALGRFGLSSNTATPARYLSAGQRRRLALARLLVAPAKLWLLDEPTTGLDEANVGVVEALLAEHRAAGGIALVATHLALALPGALDLQLGRTAVPASA